MVSFHYSKFISYEGDMPLIYREGCCLSTDTKPVNGIFEDTRLANGSSLREIDSGTIYHFDADSRAWLPWGT